MRTTSGLLISLALCCGGPSHPPIERQLDGDVHVSSFVPPYSYEWTVRAERHMTLGNFEAAVNAFRQARTGVDEDPWLLTRLARAQACAGQHEEAAHTLSFARDSFPGHPWIKIEEGFLKEFAAAPQGASHQPLEERCRSSFGPEESEAASR